MFPTRIVPEKKNIRQKNILQLNIKRNQSVHMDFMIYLYNLGDRVRKTQKTYVH